MRYQHWSILVSFCDCIIFQKYVGLNYFAVKLADKTTIICDFARQNSILLDPTPATPISVVL